MRNVRAELNALVYNEHGEECYNPVPASLINSIEKAYIAKDSVGMMLINMKLLDYLIFCSDPRFPAVKTQEIVEDLRKEVIHVKA